MCHSARAPSGRTHSAHRTEKRLGYCIAHNPLLLQPLRHWFTFIFRKYEHLAVGSLGQGLTRSRGHPFLGRLALPFCAFIIAHSLLFVKHFFEKSEFYFLGFRLHLLLSRSVLLAKSLVEELGNTPWNRTFVEMSFRTPFVPLLYHTLRGLSRGFLNFFVR